MAWRTALTSDAKLSYAGDEGAGIQIQIEGGVYAEEERCPASEDSENESVLPRTATRSGARKTPVSYMVQAAIGPFTFGAASGKLVDDQHPMEPHAAEFREAPGAHHSGSASTLRAEEDRGGKRPPSAMKKSNVRGDNRVEYAGYAGGTRADGAGGESRKGSARPGSATRRARPGTASSVLFKDADAAYTAYDSGSDEEPGKAVGTGVDLALFLLPSKPGVGHTLYTDPRNQSLDKIKQVRGLPILERLNIVDYLSNENGTLRPYQQDSYYEGASIRAVDYWNLKRVAREIRKGIREDSDVFCSSGKAANLVRIDALMPSRQVKFEAGARIRAVLSHHAWLWRRKKAAIKMQATYRMYLTKVVTRKKRAEKRMADMENNGREALKKERSEKLAAEEKKRIGDDVAAAKLQAEMEAKSQQDAAMAEAAKLQAEINALQKLIESSGEEEDDDDDDEEEEEEEEEEETDSKASGEGKERAGAEKAERKRMKEVLKASGMPKAEMAGMLKLYARSKQPGVELSAMEQQKIEMLETMMDAEAKKLASCAVLLQSFWRGLIERRQIGVEMERMRYRTRIALHSTMVTSISRVYRGHVARRFLRYAMEHAARMARLGRVVKSEGFTRQMVQKRIENKRKQLQTVITVVQRVYRGHLGRRRFAAAATFAWELRLHLAAKTIQAFYRDLIDRQWAKYVNKGNLQVLVGRQAARELSHLHKAQLTGTHTTGTLKPPIKKFYSTGVLSRISILNDGVPIREPLRALKLAKHAKPPPSHPHSVVMRNRWGMPHDFKSLDSTSQTVVKVAEKLSVIADEIADARRKDREHEFWGGGGGGGEALEEAEEEAEAEAGERRPPSSQFVRNRNMRGSLSDSGLAGLVEQGVLTGTDGYRGSRPASREGAGGEVVQVLQVLEEEDRGPHNNWEAGEEAEGGEGGARRASSFAWHGHARAGSLRAGSPQRRADGSWDYGDLKYDSHKFSKYADAGAHHWYDEEAPDSPPVPSAHGGGNIGGKIVDALPRFAPPQFGTETERFHIAPGQSQIMPTYLRLQYRDEASRRQQMKLKELDEEYAGALKPPQEAAAVKHAGKAGVGGSLLALSRARHQDYSKGRAKVLPSIGASADYFRETEVVEEEEVDPEEVGRSKRHEQLLRLGSLGKFAFESRDLVLNLRRRKMLEAHTKHIRNSGLEVPRDGGAAELCWGHPSVGNTASLANTGGSSLQSLQSLQGSGSSAVEKALGAFSLSAPLGAHSQAFNSLVLTRKANRLPYPVPVDRKGHHLLSSLHQRGRGGGGGDG